ncbi:MAG: nitroreductase family protein, partial [Propionibacterium sp.]
HRERSQANIEFETGNIARNSPPDRKDHRIKDRANYYNKLMPLMYSRAFGILGLGRKLVFSVISLFRPMVTDVTEADIRVVVHKSCALAAQTFMMAMTEAGYDTCPIEGFDQHKVRRILSLPRSAEVSLVVACGIRKPGRGIWGERFRVPFSTIYHRI